MNALVIAEHMDGQVRDVTYELIAAAADLGGPVVVAAIGPNPAALDLNRVGVDEIVHVRVEPAAFESDVYQQVVEKLIADRSPEVVLVGFSVNSIGYVPAVAAKLGLGFASDVFAIKREGESILATRAFYGSKVHAELEFPSSRPIILITGSRARHKEFAEQSKGDVDISTADFLLSIGRGIGEKENIAIFERLAEKMAATLAVSRPLVDAGWMPSSRQVGQSGKTVKPKVYLAMGISGAVQHLAGMKASGTIIAINKDPEAAMFNSAHYGAVADLFEVARELEKLY